HRVNANTHNPIRFTSGTNARIVHHRLRPARCRIFATGTATMMINRSGIPRGITQCHSGGTALQNQNWSQKIPFLSLPAFFVTSGCLVDKAAICNERSHVSPNVLVLSPSPVRVEVLALAKPGRCAFEQSLLQFV